RNVPLSQYLVEFARLNQELIGTIVIGFAVTLAFVLLDLLWMVPLQQSSRRPVVFWLVWFIITFACGIWLPDAGKRVFEHYLGMTTEQRIATSRPLGTLPSTQLASDSMIWFSIGLLVMVGSVYYLWTTSLLFRRITEV